MSGVSPDRSGYRTWRSATRRGGARTLVQGRQGPVFGGGQYRDLRRRRDGEPHLPAGSRAGRRRSDRGADAMRRPGSGRAISSRSSAPRRCGSGSIPIRARAHLPECGQRPHRFAFVPDSVAQLLEHEKQCDRSDGRHQQRPETAQPVREEEKHVLSHRRPPRRKSSGYRQGSPLVGFQGNLLRQHHVACDEIISGHETPADAWAVRFIQLKILVPVPWRIRYRFPLWQPVTSKYLCASYCASCSGESHALNSPRPRASLSFPRPSSRNQSRTGLRTA